ncbi:hypothetical protein BC827DRAFT_1170990 [Russula dissimulans]|nr:hypothetical protein BC827DRAFT_1170990 [Russula dissimulans]
MAPRHHRCGCESLEFLELSRPGGLTSLNSQASSPPKSDSPRTATLGASVGIRVVSLFTTEVQPSMSLTAAVML